MGKARDGSECYTRQNKSGANYVTCEGSQQKRAARRKLKAGGAPPVMTKRPKPVISQRPPGRIETGTLNPGKVVTDFDASAIVHEAPGVVGMTAGMFSGTPIQQRGFYKEDIMSMLGIMNERNQQREQEIVAAREAGSKMIDLNRESAPEYVNSKDLFKPPRFRNGEKFTFKFDVGYSSHISPYARTAIYTPSGFITDKEGLTLKKFTPKEMKDPKYGMPEMGEAMEYAVYYLDAEPGTKSYRESREMRYNKFNRIRFAVDYKTKQILEVGIIN